MFATFSSVVYQKCSSCPSLRLRKLTTQWHIYKPSIKEKTSVHEDFKRKICAICKEKANISTYTKFRIFTLTIAPSTKPPSAFSSSGSPLTVPDLPFLAKSKWLCKLDLGLFEAILLKFPAKCVCVLAYGTLYSHIKSRQSKFGFLTDVTPCF